MQNKPNSKRVVNIVMLSIFCVLLVNLIFNILPFINSFLLGTFGLFSYVALIAGITLTTMNLLGKKVVVAHKDVLLYAVWLLIFVLIIHLATSAKWIDSGYGKYIASCYHNKYTAGGALTAILGYIIPYLTHDVGAYVLYSIGLVIVTTVIIERIISGKRTAEVAKAKMTDADIQATTEVEEEQSEPTTPKEEPYDNDIFIKDNTSPVDETVTNKDKEKAKVLLGLKKEAEKPTSTVRTDNIFNYTDAPTTDKEEKTPANAVYSNMNSGNKPSRIYHDEDYEVEAPVEQPSKPVKAKKLSERDAKNLEFLRATTGYYSELDDDKSKDIYDDNLTLKDFNKNKQSYINKIEEIDNAVEEIEQGQQYDDTNDNDIVDNDNFAEDNSPVEDVELDIDQPIEFEPVDRYTPPTKKSPYTMETTDKAVEAKAPKQISITEISPKPKPKPKYRKPSNYIKPPIDLLRVIPHDNLEVTDDLREKGRMLEETLSNFKIPAKIISITKGPAFTRYELQITALGIPVKRIANYVDDLAMAIQSRGHIRLELPIPGKNAFGIEVPNNSISPVGLRDIIESYNFQNSKSKLTFALGKDITSECKVSSIDKCVHMLVAGSTGSGKSVCLNTMLISLMYKTGPEDLKFILIDPKRVEFSMYADLPHMLIPKPINDPLKAVDALSWVIEEMTRRYTLFSNTSVHNISEYNDLPEVQQGNVDKMYYLVVVVDELNDLMMQARRDVEEKVMRITQLARAAGIHLIVATQRPSVDVITGTIKTNLPTRIAFAVTSYNDSKTILDQAGAEDLLGKGDMLFSPSGSNEPMRIQGAYLTNEEIQNVINFIKENNEAYFDDAIEDAMFNKNNNGSFSSGGDDNLENDPLFQRAVHCVIQWQYASISKLQREFHIGYNKAASIVDLMVKLGYISPPDSKHNYTIFIDEREYEEKFGEDF